MNLSLVNGPFASVTNYIGTSTTVQLGISFHLMYRNVYLLYVSRHIDRKSDFI